MRVLGTEEITCIEVAHATAYCQRLDNLTTVTCTYQGCVFGAVRYQTEKCE